MINQSIIYNICLHKENNIYDKWITNYKNVVFFVGGGGGFKRLSFVLGGYLEYSWIFFFPPKGIVLRIMLGIQTILQKNYKLLMWWMIIGKWKSDINDGSRWKPIRGWSHQHFVKML